MAAKEGGQHLTGEVASASTSQDPAQDPTQSPAQSPAASATNAAPASSWKGRRIKRFKLVDELGEGAMGRVFIAEDTILRRHVALKLLPSKHRDGRPNHRTERLITEARSAATLEHPSVVTIHEIDQSGGVHYIAMELVEGGNLERLVQMSGPMEIERACQLVAEAAEALAHAHSRGIVHRDVKPANLLLTRSGRCKVCDFGLAMVETPEGDPTKLRCVGTPYFIAPEIAQGKGATELSDIYSLGCTLFFLLTGRPPFPGTNSRQVLKLHISEPLPDLRRWRADVPDRLITALQQACAKDPLNRYNNAERFAKILRTFTITPGGAQSASGMSPVVQNSNYAAAVMMGSSAQMAPVGNSNQYAPSMPPNMSAAISNAIAPGSSGMHSPNLSGNQSGAFSPPARHAIAPILWAGAGVMAAVALLALGVWFARQSHGDKSSENLPPMAVASAPMPASPPASPAPSPAAAAAVKHVAAPSAAVATPKPRAASPAASPAAAIALSATPAGNVLTNSRMEDASVDGVLAGWSIADRFKDRVQLLRENGNHFLRLTNDDAAQTIFVDQIIDVDPSWKSIIVSARMRAMGFKVGSAAGQDARVRLAFRDALEKRIGGWPPMPNVRANSGWVERTTPLDVPSGAKTLYVQLAIFNATGTVDFDDITIVPQK